MKKKQLTKLIQVNNKDLKGIIEHRDIIEQYLNGAKVERYNEMKSKECWEEVEEPEFYHLTKYRVKKEESVLSWLKEEIKHVNERLEFRVVRS